MCVKGYKDSNQVIAVASSKTKKKANKYKKT